MATVAYNLDLLDDPLIADGTPSFDGGQVSNNRANLLRPNESALLVNCDIEKFGRVRTRRGTVQLGSGVAGVGTYVQGLINYRTSNNNYLVAVNSGKIWKYEEPNWTQIALGGVFDNDVVHVVKFAQINNAGGYAVGATVLTVDGIVGPVAVGEQFVVVNYGPVDLFFYTITDHVETAGNTTQITIDAPGLVAPIFDNWRLAIDRQGAINNAAGYPGGTTVITIDGYTGAVSNGDEVLIDGEGIRHNVTAHVETAGNTTQLTLDIPILGAFVSANTGAMFPMAAGDDQIFWSDTVGTIYGWDGTHTTNFKRSTVWWKIIPAFLNKLPDTTPPSGASTIVWFQSRLIAAGMPDQPDAVYFSDFLDPGSWDRTFQQVRVGGGESDPITTLFGWTDLNLLVFKQNSIYVVNCDPSQNPDPSDPTQLVASFAIKVLTKNVGCPAPRSVALIGGRSDQPGSDVFFLGSDLNIRSVRRTIAAETQQQVGESLSLEPDGGIQDILNRINRQAVHTSCACYHDNKYILAVPVDGAVQPNVLIVFNVITQTWAGVWIGWGPTMFSSRTSGAQGIDLCFGQWNGTVYGWLDDQTPDEETPASYQDNGLDIPTRILTRAFTLADPFCPKTGMNVEFEFQDSDATVNIQAILDKLPNSDIVAPPFPTTSAPGLHLPVVIPFVLPVAASMLRVAFDLERYGQWRDLQFSISSESGKLQMRSIRLTGLIDSLVLQT